MSLEKSVDIQNSEAKAQEQTSLPSIQSDVELTCNHEMSDVIHTAVEYWSTSPRSHCAEVHYHFVSDNELVCSRTAIDIPEDKPNEETPVLSPSLPVEDMTQIKCLSDLAKVKRVATRFPLFKDLQNENDIKVTSNNDVTMNVHYKDIRYVENFLFRVHYQNTVGQYQPHVHGVFHEMYDDFTEPRLSRAERAVALCLLSQRRCDDETLVALLNLKLQQLSASTFELIRRGVSMGEVLDWYVDEYIYSAERENIKDVVSVLKVHSQKTGLYVYNKWKQQYEILKVVGRQLMDLCIAPNMPRNSALENTVTKFYKDVTYEISALNCLLEPSYEHEIHSTFCLFTHLLQVYELSHAMTTTSLIRTMQRRIDFLVLIIMEHNMRAQTQKLSFGKEFYRLAYENTVLASELLQVNLFYDRHEATVGVFFGLE